MAIQVIPKTDVVNVLISLQSTAIEARNFGLPLIVTPETDAGINQKERLRTYFNIDEVAVDWPTSSEAYLAAQTIFSQSPRPEAVQIGVRFTTDQAGFMVTGAVSAALAAFQAVSDGSFAVTIDGTPTDVTALNFTTDTSFDDVAATIATAIAPATCTWDSATSKFTFTSSTTGDTSEVSALSAVSPATGTDVSGSAFLNGQSSAANVVPGLTVGIITDELQNISDVDDAWYFLVTTKETRDNADVELIAAWVEARTKQYFTTTNDVKALDPNDLSDTAGTLQAAGYERTWVQYSSTVDDYPECVPVGIASTVNFSGTDSVITLFLKESAGVTAETGSSNPAFTSNSLNNLRQKNVNVITFTGGKIGIQGNAKMIGGTVYQDEIHGADWLADAMETEIFNLLSGTATRVPYTEGGIDQIEQKMRRSLKQAVNNGLIAAVIGQDGRIEKNAYTVARVAVRNTSSSDRGNRVYKGFKFVGYLSGAIHGVKPINGTLTIDQDV
jgi:hypothetical protein